MGAHSASGDPKKAGRKVLENFETASEYANVFDKLIGSLANLFTSMTRLIWALIAFAFTVAVLYFGLRYGIWLFGSLPRELELRQHLLRQ
jgi:hypothetical protein